MGNEINNIMSVTSKTDGNVEKFYKFWKEKVVEAESLDDVAKEDIVFKSFPRKVQKQILEGNFRDYDHFTTNCIYEPTFGADDDIIDSFDTNSAPPLLLLKRLSKIFDVMIELKWEDENMDEAGIYKVSKGNVLKDEWGSLDKYGIYD